MFLMFWFIKALIWKKKATSPYNTEQYKEGLQGARMHVPVCMDIARLSIIIGNLASKLIQIRYSTAISDDDKKIIH